MGADQDPKADRAGSTLQLIGKWNSTTWQLHSWPGQELADADTSMDQSASTENAVAATGVSVPIVMHFDGGAPCLAQPEVNFSATVRTLLRASIQLAATSKHTNAKMTVEIFV